MKQESAETIALQALGWMAADPEILGGFLAASGLGPGDVAARAQEPEFLAAVVDHVMQQDAWVLDFCASAGLAPSSLMQVRASLPGGATEHWT